jgi:membrane protein YdbS with pleckstrin-like domain
MTTIPHQPSAIVPERERWSKRLLVPEMWASVAIIFMWLAVLFSAIYGTNIVSTTAGGDSSTVPSAIVVALFAFLGTWVVARYGFTRWRKDND